MKHPNTVLLAQMYSDFNSGNFQGFLDACSDAVTFQLSGKSPLAGKYTKENFISGFTKKLGELTQGHYSLEVHDILASDLHAAVLATSKVTRNGKTTELRTVHIWRISEGKPLAWYEYPRDLYQFDATWGA